MFNERIHRSIRRAMSHRATLQRAVFVGAAACVALPVVAADTGGQQGVEEVIVTASRRETNLQDTPIAVTAFSQTALDQAHASDLAGLQSFVPNLTVEQHGDSGGVHVYLRGVGSANHTELGDPAVAFHIDEVYSPRPQGATVLMHDLEHVEVLRGPQGTLFGRNSTAGTVNLVTAKPHLDDFDAYADITFGDYNRVGTRGMLNIPLSDTFGVRAAVATERHDGYVDFQPRSSAVQSRKYGAADQKSARLTALFAPNDAWTVTGAVDYFKDNGTGNIALMQHPRAGQDLYSALVDTAGFLDQTNLAYRLRVDFRPTESLEVSYIGGKADMERQNASDNDGGANPGFKQEHRTEWSNFDSYSHELSVKSIGESRLQWIAGAYTMHEDNSIRFDIDISQVTPPPEPEVIVVNPVLPTDTAWAMSFIQPKRTLDSQALFAQATFGFTESLRFTGGARYTDEEKEDQGGRNWVCPQFGATVGSGGHLIGPGGVVSVDTCDSDYAPGTWPGGGANDGKTKDNKTTWLARLEYDISDAVLGYASVSTGFKSGGLSDGGRRHLPEELTSYEVGFKTELLERSLTLNLSAFLMDYEDMQVSAVERLPSGQQQLVTSNAASASIKGLEAEFAWRPTVNDTLSGFASYLNAEFDEFLTIDTTYFNQGDLGNTVDLAGRPLRHAPDFSFTGIYEHQFNMPSGGALVPRISLHYETDSIITAFNDVYPDLYQGAGAQDAYTQTDLSLRYDAPKGNWTVEAFVLNLEDEEVKTDIYNVGASSDGTPTSGPSNLGTWMGFYNPPRTYGLRLHVNF
jgi:iron complex outermembrane receptor protein